MALMFKSVLQSGGGAELIVTCDSEFAGATISCSDGTTTLNKTCPVSSPYEVTFKIPNSGDWTISATVSGTTYSSDPISVDLDYETDLEFGFNWKRWVDTAQYLDSTDYSTLSDLLADEEALRELCLEHACVDYLCNGASVTPALATVLASDLFAKWANNSDYALDNMYANAAIKTVMDTADKYGYGEWVITDSTTTPVTWGAKGNVPIMTSNTTPYGAAQASACLDAGSGSSPRYYDAYLAFNTDTYAAYPWHSGVGNLPAWIQYKSAVPMIVKRVDIQNVLDATIAGNVTAYTLQGSNDGSTWIDIGTKTRSTSTSGERTSDYFEDNETPYLYHRVYVSTVNSGNYVRIMTLQFYGRELSVSVPTMTGNTTPYGEASGDSLTSSSYPAWKAFDGDSSSVWLSSGTSNNSKYVEYDFISPLVAKLAILTVGLGTASTLLQSLKYHVEVFDLDTNDWVAISEVTEKTANTSSTYYITIADKRISKIKYVVDQNYHVGNNYGGGDVYTLQVYGLDYSEKEFEEGTTKKWLYDHGVKLVDTYDGIGSTAGCRVEYRDDEIVSRDASGNSAFTQFAFIYFPAENPINLSNYTLAKSKFGDMLLNPSGTGIYANLVNQVSVRTVKQSGTYSDDNRIAGYDATIPVANTEGCLDISSVSGNAYICLGAGYWANQIVTYKELWLE